MNKKKILVWVLTLLMTVALLPAAAFADAKAPSASGEVAMVENEAQGLLIERRDRTLRYDLVKAASKTIQVLKISDTQRILTFEKAEGAKYFKVAKKTGSITIGQGTPVGEYAVKIKVSVGASSGKILFSKDVSVKIKITPGIQPMTVSPNHQTVAYSSLKSGSVPCRNVVTVKGAVGKVTYKKISGSDYIYVNPKTGAIWVKKGTPKSTGTYRIGIKVMAAGNKNYKAAKRTVTVHVTVK